MALRFHDDVLEPVNHAGQGELAPHQRPGTRAEFTGRDGIVADRKQRFAPAFEIVQRHQLGSNVATFLAHRLALHGNIAANDRQALMHGLQGRIALTFEQLGLNEAVCRPQKVGNTIMGQRTEEMNAILRP